MIRAVLIRRTCKYEPEAPAKGIRVWRSLALQACVLAFAAVACAQEPATDPSPEDEAPPTKNIREPGQKPARLPGRRFQNAKELLELLGVDSSQWKNLFQNQPLGPADEEFVDRILYHLPRVGLEYTHRWRKTDWSFGDIAASPEGFQGEVLPLRGRATKCECVPLVAELVDRYEFDHYYRVTLQLEPGKEAIVCTRTVPDAWTMQDKLDERAESNGIFLKASPVENASPQLVCVSQRVAWLPDKVDESRGITSTAVLLAEHGFDFGLWSQLHGPPHRGLDDNDREPFFQLLGAVKSLDPADTNLHKAVDLDIPASIQSPDKQRGMPVTVEGSVVRIDRVEVEDGDVQARFGLDHYYELFVFVPLKKGIKLQRSTKDKNPRIFANHFPVTVCVPELPPQLSAGANVHEHVRMQGIYFKVWHYKIQADDPTSTAVETQASPLILAPKVALIQDEVATGPAGGVAIGIVVLTLIGTVAVVMWRIGRSDARFKREVLEKKILREDKVDLSGLKE